MKACRKFLALILSLSLLDFGGISNQVYAADPPHFSSAISAKGSKEKLDPRSITQPLQPYARIGQYYSSTQKEGPTLIHIRDLHCNYEAQINISKTLESLSAELKKSGHLHEEPLLVLTEGADGQVDTSLFASFPDNEIRTQAAREFVKAGKMTGPEYLSIAKPYDAPVQIVGIEEGNLYLENLKAFRDVIGQRQMTESFIKDVNERLEMFKQKAFSKELLEMDQKESGYQTGAMAFDEYAKYLSEKVQDPKSEIRKEDYPNFALLTEVLEKQKNIVVDDVENERNKVMDELSDKVSKDDLAKLIKRSLEFRLGKITAQEYFEELDRLIGEHLKKENYPNLGQYIELVKLQSGVDHRLLLDEVEDMTSKVRQSLVKTGEEKELLEFSRQIDIVGKMFKLEMTREDLAFYKENKKLCNVESLMKQLDKFVLKYGLDIPSSLKGEAKVRQYTKVFEDGDRFYEMALQRDQAMMAKSMQAMEGKNIQVAVLITGGFHSDGVTELLERKDVAYVVATPKVSGEPDMTGYYNLMLDERITVATIAFVSLFNGIAGRVSESLQGQELDRFADLLMRLMANKGIKNDVLTGWIDRWVEQKGGVEKLKESQPAMEQLITRLQSQLSPEVAGQQAALMTDQMIQELMNSPNLVTAELTVEVLREMGHPQMEQIQKQLDARRRGLYSSMDEMAQGLPKAIGEKLQQSGLEAGEAKAAVRLIDLVKGLYEAMGLMKKGYHNQVHNLGVVFANLTIATSSGLAKAPRDVKVAFLAAMLHDFHVREPTMMNKEGKEQGTPAFVEETMKQLRDLLGLPLPSGPPQEGRYNNTVTDEMRSEFRKTIGELMGQENLADLFAEAEAMIRRTDFASNVAPPPQQAGYVKAQAAESRKNMDGLITQGKSLADVRSAVEQNYEKIYQAVEVDEKLNADQKQMARTWLDRQKGIELAYLDALSKSSQDRQIQVHQLANRLEKGADQSGFYWLTTPEMVEREVVPGLQEEIPMVNVAGSYPFFFVPELLNPEVLVILKDLPLEYKKNLIEVMRHFSKKSAEAGAKMPDSVPVKGLFQGAQADWQKREPDVLAKLGLEMGPEGEIREVVAPVISIATAAQERVTQTETGKRETFEKAKEGAEFLRAAAGPIEVRTAAETPAAARTEVAVTETVTEVPADTVTLGGSSEAITLTTKIDSKGQTALLSLEYPATLQPVTINGVEYTPKPEFHVTVVGFGHKFLNQIKEKFGIKNNKEAQERARQLLEEAAQGITFATQRTGRYRMVEKEFEVEAKGGVKTQELRKTVVELVDINGMEEFYQRLDTALGSTLSRTPAHITLFTSGNPQGIGLNSQKDLEDLAREPTLEERAAIETAAQVVVTETDTGRLAPHVEDVRGRIKDELGRMVEEGIANPSELIGRLSNFIASNVPEAIREEALRIAGEEVGKAFNKGLPGQGQGYNHQILGDRQKDRMAEGIAKKLGIAKERVMRFWNGLDREGILGPMWVNEKGEVEASRVLQRLLEKFLGLSGEKGESPTGDRIRDRLYHEYAHQILKAAMNENLQGQMKGFVEDKNHQDFMKAFAERYGTNDPEEILAKYVSYTFTGEDKDLFERETKDSATGEETGETIADKLGDMGILANVSFQKIAIKNENAKQIVDQIWEKSPGLRNRINRENPQRSLKEIMIEFRNLQAQGIKDEKLPEEFRAVQDLLSPMLREGSNLAELLIGEGGTSREDQRTRLKALARQVAPRINYEGQRNADQAVKKLIIQEASPVLNRMDTLVEDGTIAKVGEAEDRNIFVVDVLALVKKVGEKDGKIKFEGTGAGLDQALEKLFGVRPGSRIKLMSPYSEEQTREILKSLGVSEEQIGQGKGKVEIVGNWSEQGFQGIVRNALGVERLEGEAREQAERDVVVVLSEETQKNLTEGREAEFKQEIKGMKVVVGKLGKEKGSHTIGDVLGMALVLGSVEKAFDEKGQVSPVLAERLKSLFEPMLREILTEQGVSETEIEAQVAQVIKDIAKEGFFRIPPVTDVFNDMMRELAIEETYIEVAA